METKEIYLSLGSNLGDRSQNISTALELLNQELDTPYERLSEIIETKSWGFSGNDFLNCVVKFEAAVSPEDLLRICKKIERKLGRTDTPEYDNSGSRIYHNRTMDIDILLYGEEEISTPELTIPHPQMKNRDFIIKCLNLLDFKTE